MLIVNSKISINGNDLVPGDSITLKDYEKEDVAPFVLNGMITDTEGSMEDWQPEEIVEDDQDEEPPKDGDSKPVEGDSQPEVQVAKKAPKKAKAKAGK
jgi:hypothetical protein